MKKILILFAASSFLINTGFAEESNRPKDVIVTDKNLQEQVLNSIGNSLELPTIEFHGEFDNGKLSAARIEATVAATFGSNIIVNFSPTDPKLGNATLVVQGLRAVLTINNAPAKSSGSNKSSVGLDEFDVKLNFYGKNGDSSDSKVSIRYGQNTQLPLGLQDIAVRVSIRQEKPLNGELPNSVVQQKILIATVLNLFRMAPSLTGEGDVKVAIPNHLDMEFENNTVKKVDFYLNKKKK